MSIITLLKTQIHLIISYEIYDTYSYLCCSIFQSIQVYILNMFRFVCGIHCVHSLLDTKSYRNFHILHAHIPDTPHSVCDMWYLYRQRGTEYHTLCRRRRSVYILLLYQNHNKIDTVNIKEMYFMFLQFAYKISMKFLLCNFLKF